MPPVRAAATSPPSAWGEHLLAPFLIAGGYAPGVVTALLLNLPAAVWLLRASRG